MADIAIDDLSLNDVTIVGLTSGSASQTLEFDGKDHKTAIVALNGDSNDAYLKVSAGDFWQSDQFPKSLGPIEQNEYGFVVLESGPAKDSDAEITVEILDSDGTAFSGTASNVELAIVELP